MLCERTQKLRIFLYGRYKKEPSPVIYMGFYALPNQGFTGFGGVIGTCRAFPEPVAAGSLKAQHTIKK